MKELELALLSASYLGISKERILEIQNENLVKFSLHVNLGFKINEILKGRSMSILKQDYSKESSNPAVFGSLQKLAFEWYFGSNSGVNPGNFSKDFPLLHKVGFILNHGKESKSKNSSFRFQPLSGGGDFLLNLMRER